MLGRALKKNGLKCQILKENIRTLIDALHNICLFGTVWCFRNLANYTSQSLGIPQLKTHRLRLRTLPGIWPDCWIELKFENKTAVYMSPIQITNPCEMVCWVYGMNISTTVCCSILCDHFTIGHAFHSQGFRKASKSPTLDGFNVYNLWAKPNVCLEVAVTVSFCSELPIYFRPFYRD